MLCKIPKEKISRICVYQNTNRKSMSQIQKALGCQFMINGGLYNMNTFKPINQLTIDGIVLSKNGNPFGYAIKDGSMIFSYDNNVKAPTFLGAYPVLVRDGKTLNEKPPVGLEGYRPRSCVGVTKSGDVVFLCYNTNRSLNAVSKELVDAGCDTAINLDGGGSSQCIFDEQRIISTRVVHNFLCIWTKAEEKPIDDSEDARKWAVQMGITDGSSPDSPITRKQVWQMLYRLNKK